MTDGEQLARQFHTLYEAMAPGFGYETRTETREFDPESNNGKLMIAVCSVIQGMLTAQLAAAEKQSADNGAKVLKLHNELERTKARLAAAEARNANVPDGFVGLVSELNILREKLAAAEADVIAWQTTAAFCGELRDDAVAKLAAAKQAAHPGLTVSKCDKCGGYVMVLQNTPGLCACNVAFTTAMIPVVCTCHKRDSSFCCDYCHSQGIYGHMEQQAGDSDAH